MRKEKRKEDAGGRERGEERLRGKGRKERKGRGIRAWVRT